MITYLFTVAKEGVEFYEARFQITVRDALQWLSAAVKRIQPSTVRKCFALAGFILTDSDLRLDNEADIAISEDNSEFIHFDDNVATCGR